MFCTKAPQSTAGPGPQHTAPSPGCVVTGLASCCCYSLLPGFRGLKTLELVGQKPGTGLIRLKWRHLQAVFLSGVCQGESVSSFSGLLAEFNPSGCRSPPFASQFLASRGCCIPRLVAPFPHLQSQQRQVGSSVACLYSLFCHCIPL